VGCLFPYRSILPQKNTKDISPGVRHLCHSPVPAILLHPKLSGQKRPINKRYSNPHKPCPKKTQNVPQPDSYASQQYIPPSPCPTQPIPSFKERTCGSN
jgi:hypothetical protein